jgi:hypothetical protein
MKMRLFLPVVLILLPLAVVAQIPERFVLIRGVDIADGQSRIEDFEILDHPVTNAEYQLFVEATGHTAPLHWPEGQMPEGNEEYPVIFVSTFDARAYMDWLSGQDGRVYRLPTGAEFKPFRSRRSLPMADPCGEKIFAITTIAMGAPATFPSTSGTWMGMARRK